MGSLRGVQLTQESGRRGPCRPALGAAQRWSNQLRACGGCAVMWPCSQDPSGQRSRGDLMRLAGKVAVVTGGGSGIGRGIVLAMAREGADLAIPDIQVLNAEKVAEEVRALGRKVIAMRTD